MKTIAKYQADDGSEWNSQQQAEVRDVLYAKVKAAMAPLGEVPEAVWDAKGWLQHDLETVNKAKDDILDICRAEGFAERFNCFKDGRKLHSLSVIGRILSDNDGPLCDAWMRFCRIDLQGREHQQTYHAYTEQPPPPYPCIEDRRKADDSGED